MPRGAQLAVMTPGTKATASLAGALALATGTLLHPVGPRNTSGLFQALLNTLEAAYQAPPSQQVYGVGDHDHSHQATAVAPWGATPPRLTRRFLPTYGPRAHPIERACGDVHDTCTRNPRRKGLRDLVSDVEEPLHLNG